MPLVLKEYVKSLLPTYVREKDSFKDGNQEGFVVRFMGALGAEWDDEYYNKVEDIIDLLNPNDAPTNFLDYIGQMLGNMPDFSQDENHYRQLLTFIISIYQVKGTKKSFISIFHALSLNTIITEIVPTGLLYDESPPLLYDAAGVNYDEDCIPCTDYDLDLTPNYDGLIEDELDSGTGWTLGAGSSIGGGQLDAVGIAGGEASKNFSLDQSTNYVVAIEIVSITNGGIDFHMSNDDTDLDPANAYLQLSTIPVTVAGIRYYNFTTNANANQSLLIDVDTNTETVVIEKIRFFKATTINGIMTSVLFRQIQLLVSLVEPINANINNLIFDGDIITAIFILVVIDSNGDLIYDNTADPDLVLTLVNGELVITGPLADRYFLQDGDLFFTTII